jgi:hypothetical protein
MARDPMILRNTKMSVVKETIEGTAVAETANGAFIFLADELAFNLDKDMVESDEITGSLTETEPQPGMFSEDLGYTVKFYIKGAGTTKSAPEYALFMESIFGQQNANTDDTVAAAPAPTTTEFTANSGSNDFDEGQLVRINDEIVRLDDITGEALTCFPPLTTTPIALDDIEAGISWMLSSDSHPTFTSYIYFKSKSGRERRLRYDGCRVVNCTMNFEVGTHATLTFTIKSLNPVYDDTAQAVTPVYETTLKPLMCTGIDGKTIFTATAKGVPTQTETILTAPPFQVAQNDYIIIDVGSSVFETVLISDVAGNEGDDQTLTHASVSVAASAGDTVYVVHTACAHVRETLEIAIEMEDVAEKCMFASSGYTGRSFTKRMVNITVAPFFEGWQEFLIRDEVLGSAYQIVCGTVDTNIFTVYIPNQITGETSLNADDLMGVDVTKKAVRDAVLGNDHEIVAAVF